MNHFQFSDRICREVRTKQSHAVIGLDPDLNLIPRYFINEAIDLFGKTPKGAANAILKFNQTIIDAIYNKVAIVKPQLAFYEIYGHEGIKVFWETVKYAQSKGLMVLADAKRGDIASTATAYATAFFGSSYTSDNWQTDNLKVDALTINPYLGSDGLIPFIEKSKEQLTGVFILAKTSNPSAGELQDRKLSNGVTVSQHVSKIIKEIGASTIGEYGYSSVGAVVGAPYIEDLKELRKIMPKNIFLVPGYGAQGGRGEDIVEAFNNDGFGALISASRSIIYANDHLKNPSIEEITHNISLAVDNMNNDINNSLADNRKLYW